MKKLDYKKMVKDIDKIIEKDEFCECMELQTMPHSKPFTQKDAKEMASRLASIYSVAHCIHCTACQKKYIL